MEDARCGTKAFYDAETYVRLRLESDGFPLKQRGKRKPGPTCSYEEGPGMPASRTVERALTYEYLPPTQANEKLLDVQQQHPTASTASAKQMSKRFRSVVNPPTCIPPPPP